MTRLVAFVPSILYILLLISESPYRSIWVSCSSGNMKRCFSSDDRSQRRRDRSDSGSLGELGGEAKGRGGGAESEQVKAMHGYPSRFTLTHRSLGILHAQTAN